MKFLDRLERKFGELAVPHIALYIIAGQVLLYFFAQGDQFDLSRVALVPSLVLHGEFWRLFSFVFFPPMTSPLWAFFYWYIFWMIGARLEDSWGIFKFNAYLLIGILLTIAASFITPNAMAGNQFLYLSAFLAFAMLFPDIEFLIFFVLPVKVKWLAALMFAGFVLSLVSSPLPIKFQIIASLGNFFLFFWDDFIDRYKTYKRRKDWNKKMQD